MSSSSTQDRRKRRRYVTVVRYYAVRQYRTKPRRLVGQYLRQYRTLRRQVVGQYRAFLLGTERYDPQRLLRAIRYVSTGHRVAFV
eukprot:3936190-Rhodomonas_salina.1